MPTATAFVLVAIVCMAGLACASWARCKKTNVDSNQERVPWQTGTATDDWSKRAAELNALDPVQTARALHGRGRLVFAGVHGFRSNMVLGVGLTDDEQCRYPTISIEGTTDAGVGGDEYYEFQDAASAFAGAFNIEMARLIRKQ